MLCKRGSHSGLARAGASPDPGPMPIRSNRLPVLLSCLTLALAAAAPTRAADETARQILDRYKSVGNGEQRWTDRQGRLKITATDPAGGGRVAELTAYQHRSPGGETKTSLFVRAPSDLKGTAVLSITRGNGETEQWRYRPDGAALERIGDASGHEAVVNSDLTFHDLALLEQMTLWTEADAGATLRGEEGIDSVATYAIEFTPRRSDIGYRKIVLWLGRDDMVPRAVDLFGDGPYPVKRIRVTGIRSEGAIPWLECLEIETPANRSRTTIEATNVVFNRRVDDDLFTPQGLTRGER